jgi:hypothetical protein
MFQIIFLLIILALFFCFVALQVLTFRRWKGWWRWVAALPGLAFLLMVLNIIIGILRDKTAHNLWPFEIVMWSVGGIVFLGLFHLLHKFTVGEK